MDVQDNSKTMAELINVTDAARLKMAELIEGADADIEAVRVFVSGGGCGGMNYGMTFADRLDERDQVFTGDVGFRLYMDPVALGYMQGAEIDYKDDGVNATFVVNNGFKSDGGSGACAGCGGAAH